MCVVHTCGGQRTVLYLHNAWRGSYSHIFVISRRGINKITNYKLPYAIFWCFQNPKRKRRNYLLAPQALPRQTNIRIGIENSVRHTYSHTLGLRLHSGQMGALGAINVVDKAQNECGNSNSIRTNRQREKNVYWKCPERVRIMSKRFNSNGSIIRFNWPIYLLLVHYLSTTAAAACSCFFEFDFDLMSSSSMFTHKKKWTGAESPNAFA